MDKKELMKNLGNLGFPMLEVEDAVDVERTLAEVVRSKNVRLWEGFPVVLRNGLERGNFNSAQVVDYLRKNNDSSSEEEQSWFWELCCMSEVLYNYDSLPEMFFEMASTKKYLEMKKRWFNNFKSGEDVEVGIVVLSLDRVKRLFQDYYFSVQVEAQKKQRAAQEGATLEYALSQVFSPKQKELFRKKLEGEPLTKTEREYYSRVVKKKVSALANEELFRLSRLVRDS